MKIKNKLLFAILGVGILPLICATGVISYSISGQVSDALYQQSSEKLTAVREVRKNQIIDYFEQLKTIVSSIADSANTATAMRDFSNGFDIYAEPDEVDGQAIKQFYQEQFGKNYRALDPKIADQKVNELYSGADQATLFYQARYIADNPNQLGSKQLLDQAASKTKFASRYDRYHATYHPEFRKQQEQFGFYDIFLINNEGRVVYTVFKEVDFATSLANGPLANSGLAKAWHAAESLSSQQVAMVDFSAYRPSYSGPAAFISSPIFEGANRVGTLVVQVSQTQINQLMTSNQKWVDVGLGETGESFIIGPDQLTRSESRQLLTQPDDFMKDVTATGIQSVNSMEEIQHRKLSTGYLKIDGPAIQKALNGESGVLQAPDYSGHEAIIAYAPVSVLGLKWAVFAQMDQAEAYQAVGTIIGSITKDTLLILIVVIIISIFFGLTMAGKLTNPLRELVTSFQDLAQGQGNLRVQLESAKRDDEIGELSVAFNAFISNIRSIVSEVAMSASQLSSVASTLRNQTSETLDGMSEQREKSQTIASAMTEFAASIDEVARNSHDTYNAMTMADQVTISGSENANRSAVEIDKLAQGTKQSAESMSYLSSQIEDISSVLEVINGIASQTSLLALNAAIEAARAGEMGRGFAVVADEVRSLSSRTQNATVDIQRKIEQLRSAAEQSVSQVNSARANAESSISLVHQTASEIEQIRRLVSDVQSMHAQITSAIGQQQSTVKEMEANVTEIHSLSQSGEKHTSLASSEANRLQQLSSRLSELVGRFST